MEEYEVASIITPVLNGAKYLEACVESVLNQTSPYIEHVFVDGGSPDGTVEVLRAYQEKYPHQLTFVLQPDLTPGSGCGEAWNKGLQLAKGDILGWLGADDILASPDAIEAVVSFFRSNSSAYFVHGACNVVDEDGKILYTQRPRNFTLRQLLNDGNFIACPSAFYNRGVGSEGYGQVRK